MRKITGKNETIKVNILNLSFDFLLSMISKIELIKEYTIEIPSKTNEVILPKE